MENFPFSIEGLEWTHFQHKNNRMSLPLFIQHNIECSKNVNIVLLTIMEISKSWFRHGGKRRLSLKSSG